jgi:hypothetical protein
VSFFLFGDVMTKAGKYNNVNKDIVSLTDQFKKSSYYKNWVDKEELAGLVGNFLLDQNINDIYLSTKLFKHLSSDLIKKNEAKIKFKRATDDADIIYLGVVSALKFAYQKRYERVMNRKLFF